MGSILCFGLNHQSAPLALLEQLSLGEEEMETCLRDLSRGEPFDEVAGLSTCNRTEFYFVSHRQEDAFGALLGRLDGRCPDLKSDDLRYYGYFHRDYHATNHLMRVAAGVDSLMVGEAQILGQLRRAWEGAAALGTVSGKLNSLLGRAVTFGRRVRQTTNIARGNVSVAAVAEKIASSAFPDLDRRTVLMLGAGETAELATQHLHKAGIGRLMVLNRTLEHSQRLATRFDGEALPADLIQSGIEQADLIIAATGAPHHILTHAGMEDIMVRRPHKPILLIDLSLPRNIDPACAGIRGVTLRSMEDLRSIASANRRQREQEVDHVERLIEEETRDFLRWAAAQESNALIDGLRRRSEEIRLRHLARFARNLPEEEYTRLDRYSDSLLRAVLHDLTSELRGSDLETEEGRLRLEVARDLFHLDPPHPDRSR